MINKNRKPSTKIKAIKTEEIQTEATQTEPTLEEKASQPIEEVTPTHTPTYACYRLGRPIS